jgi:adenosylhomocysteine nucleosidase
VTVIAVTGMTKEAEIVGTGGVIAVVGGGNTKALAARLEALHGDISGIISIGLAGALSPLLKVGDVVIADRIVSGDEIWRCDNRWRVALGARLASAHHGSLAASDIILESPTTKAALFEASGGALAVDMESQVAARFALKRQLPLTALRVISDDAGHVLPPAALVAMMPDGGIALGRVLRSLARHPLQIGALIRTARSANRAFAELLRCRDLCGVGFSCPDI